MVAFWEIAAHSAYDMFSYFKYPIVNLVFSHLGFWSGNFFLIARFSDHCLLEPFHHTSLPSLGALNQLAPGSTEFKLDIPQNL